GCAGRHPSEPPEFAGIVGETGTFEGLLERYRLGGDGKCGAIARRDLIKVIGDFEASRARHILRDHRGISRNVASKMTREQSTVEVVSAAGAVADIEIDRLAEKRVERRRVARRD